jgi:pentatricopeptide repeat protein
MVKFIICVFQAIRLVGATFVADRGSLLVVSAHARPRITSDSKQQMKVAFPLPSTRTRQISQSFDPLLLLSMEPNDAMPIRGPRSRDPSERTTNQYAFIETNDKLIPERKENATRKGGNQTLNRQQGKIGKVKKEYSGSTINKIDLGSTINKSDSYMSLEAAEQMARGKYFRSNASVSQRILINFQSATSKQALQNLTRELINMKTTNKKGTDIALSELIIPRDQTSLIRLLGANGCYKSMICLLRHLAVKMDISAAQYAYTAAITAIAQASNQRIRVQAIRLLDEMDAKSIPPSTYTFTAVFLSVDGGKAAMDLLKRAKEHKDLIEIDVHLYNSCIHACSRAADNGKNGWQNALSLFRQQMPRDGIQPNEQTYASLLHACAKAGQLRVALSIFDEMKRNTKVPVTFNKVWGAALRACATAGNGEKAMELMGEMIVSGVRPNTLHFNSVFAALSKEGNDVTALELFENMQAGTVEHLFQEAIISKHKRFSGEDISAMPDLVSVNTVLTSFTHAGNYGGAKAFFKRVRAGEFTSKINGKRHIVRPDIISYNTLLSSCEDPKEAFAILEEVSMNLFC